MDLDDGELESDVKPSSISSHYIGGNTTAMMRRNGDLHDVQAANALDVLDGVSFSVFHAVSAHTYHGHSRSNAEANFTADVSV